jgi:putative ABC transport system ATP-binding protein
VIEWRGVGLRFAERGVLNDFSLRVAEGERVVIRGASGVGKSSLFRMLLGFSPVDVGAVFFWEREVDAESVWAVRREVAFLPQAVALGEGTAREAVVSMLGFRANRERVVTEQGFAELGLGEGILDQDVASLSGGETQRVGLAIALMLRRKVYLLDEPTAALDEVSRGLVVARIRALPGNCTVVVIAHDDAWTDGFREVTL